ncbi:MAG: hypothetical protein ABII18_07000 [bacterium]|nr:hypothetical protein [bacterium]MBU1917791.1 hypothetical protein [bacterium]
MNDEIVESSWITDVFNPLKHKSEEPKGFSIEFSSASYETSIIKFEWQRTCYNHSVLTRDTRTPKQVTNEMDSAENDEKEIPEQVKEAIIKLFDTADKDEDIYDTGLEEFYQAFEKKISEDIQKSKIVFNPTIEQYFDEACLIAHEDILNGADPQTAIKNAINEQLANHPEMGTLLSTGLHPIACSEEDKAQWDDLTERLEE